MNMNLRQPPRPRRRPRAWPVEPLHPAPVRGAHLVRHEAPRPLHQALRGPHHLPRRAGRRRLGRRRHRPAASCWSRQDPDRDILMYINSPGGSFTAMTAIYDTMQYIRPRHPDRSSSGQAASAAAVLLGGRRARASGSPCRTPACSSTSRRIEGGTTARPPTSRSTPTRSSGCARGSRRRSRDHSGRTSEQVRKDIERDKILSAADGQGVRPHRRGARLAQELARELTPARPHSDQRSARTRALRWSGRAAQPPGRRGVRRERNGRMRSATRPGLRV